MGGDAIDWGRNGQDKGQGSGGQGWRVDTQTLCACRPRLCGLQTGVGGVSLGVERKAGSRLGQREGAQVKCWGPHLRRPPGSGPGETRRREAGSEVQRGPPRPAHSEDAPQAMVRSCVSGHCPLSLRPSGPRQQGTAA